MGTGTLKSGKLVRILEQAKDLEGDYAEIGVHMGANFKTLIAYAGKHDKKAWAFDSFRGMDDRTEKDSTYYPKGKFDIGGVDTFINNMPGTHNVDYYAKAGYIPTCFEGVYQDFCFVYLDVDTYTPTSIALPWVWNQLVTGGFILFDDYFREGNWGGASEPIDKFLADHAYRELEYENNQLLVQKL